MDKIHLEVITLTTSASYNNSFAVILGEVEGSRRLPIVIGNAEAQSIVVAMENIRPTRPLTHDLMKSVMNAYEVVLKEVVISKFLEGIFYAELICDKNGQEEKIDSRTSDAIAIAIRMNAPIYTYPSIMDMASIEVDLVDIVDEDEDELDNLIGGKSIGNYKKYSTDELKKMLDESLEKEDYEKAASLRDEIDRRSKN
ncbi:MAG: DUF151 domain-containing protein [Chitinophagales bacterium]|nr:DUF151 domain-containing protein [Chitinophagales bacterium]